MGSTKIAKGQRESAEHGEPTPRDDTQDEPDGGARVHARHFESVRRCDAEPKLPFAFVAPPLDDGRRDAVGDQLMPSRAVGDADRLEPHLLLTRLQRAVRHGHPARARAERLHPDDEHHERPGG
jgi:hypothetical protein